MKHELAAAEMVIESIRNQIKFTESAGMTQANLESLTESIKGSIAIYDRTRSKLHKIDEVA